MILNRNIAVKIHVTRLISLNFRKDIFTSTYDINPQAKPIEILYEKGMASMVMNTGSPTSISLKSIFEMEPSIRKPTNISAGAVAAAGTSMNTGENINASKKSNPVTTEVNPVLPPAATPVDDSIYEVTVVAPNKEPTEVAIASDSNAFFTLITLPSLSRRLPCEHTANKVATVSNRSTNSSVIITVIKSPILIADNPDMMSTGV